MAWIRYYIRLSNALVAVVSWILPDGVLPALSVASGSPQFTHPCCLAARVRRCTAATGE